MLINGYFFLFEFIDIVLDYYFLPLVVYNSTREII
jgi:hypothetical protein